MESNKQVRRSNCRMSCSFYVCGQFAGNFVQSIAEHEIFKVKYLLEGQVHGLRCKFIVGKLQSKSGCKYQAELPISSSYCPRLYSSANFSVES